MESERLDCDYYDVWGVEIADTYVEGEVSSKSRRTSVQRLIAIKRAFFITVDKRFDPETIRIAKSYAAAHCWLQDVLK